MLESSVVPKKPMKSLGLARLDTRVSRSAAPMATMEGAGGGAEERVRAALAESPGPDPGAAGTRPERPKVGAGGTGLKRPDAPGPVEELAELERDAGASARAAGSGVWGALASS